MSSNAANIRFLWDILYCGFVSRAFAVWSDHKFASGFFYSERMAGQRRSSDMPTHISPGPSAPLMIVIALDLTILTAIFFAWAV